MNTFATKSPEDFTPSVMSQGELSLAGWQLRGEMSPAWSRIRDVKCLDVSDNRITALPEDVSNWSDMESLILSQNELRAFELASVITLAHQNLLQWLEVLGSTSFQRRWAPCANCYCL